MVIGNAPEMMGWVAEAAEPQVQATFASWAILLDQTIYGTNTETVAPDLRSLLAYLDKQSLHSIRRNLTGRGTSSILVGADGEENYLDPRRLLVTVAAGTLDIHRTNSGLAFALNQVDSADAFVETTMYTALGMPHMIERRTSPLTGGYDLLSITIEPGGDPSYVGKIRQLATRGDFTFSLERSYKQTRPNEQILIVEGQVLYNIDQDRSRPVARIFTNKFGLVEFDAPDLIHQIDAGKLPAIDVSLEVADGTATIGLAPDQPQLALGLLTPKEALTQLTLP